jgi:hypothetical protein
MKSTLLAIAMATGLAAPALATDGAERDAVAIWEDDPSTVFDAADVVLEDFLWIARPVVIFADTPRQPDFEEQMELLLERQDELVERDVVIIVDTDPSARTALRTKLRPRSFQLTLIGKDGGVKLRKPFPWDVRELTRSIDKMPVRLREIREAREAAKPE